MAQDLHSMVNDSAFYGTAHTETMDLEGVVESQQQQQHNDHEALLQENAPHANGNLTSTTPAATTRKMSESIFYDTSPTDATAMNHSHNASSKLDETAPAEQVGEGEANVAGGGGRTTPSTSTTEANSPPEEPSEFDMIANEIAELLDKKLDNTRGWTKKLLREITVYVKTLEDVHTEYVRVQRLEHEESDRLDQVEPDVHGATSHLLDYALAGANSGNNVNVAAGRSSSGILGSKRERAQA